ncbi:hypothetical protein H312_01581 [Anncaliia algerae PRA339]|uniref:GPI mannosyltransferase 2 n=1 Tax=Anncaliia algerae PRA339 TaxID=1288291 RepID=A0A059F1Y0_9MICR|nr:hypothetical protein H312_01581 [Anncaliia algerae PRA339]
MNLKKYIFIMLLSLVSRIIYILISYLSFISFTSYDKSTDLISQSKLRFLLRWDAINFYEIAKHGYTSEHLLAFFPLYPYIISIIPIDPLISGILISNLCFIGSTLILYILSERRYNDYVCYTSILLFMVNPSSIIFSTLYTESLFTFLFLIILLIIEEKKMFISDANTYRIKNMHCKLILSLLVGLLSIIRSNGILFFLILYFYLPKYYIIFSSLPFVMFQIFGYMKIQKFNVHIPYSYIQKRYWDQGFLKFYFDMKNIPNFFIALPFLSFGIYLIICYIYTLKNKECKKERLRDVNNRILMLIFTIQTIMSIFFIHSQIYFRFISFNPLIYWSIALMIEQKGIRNMSYVITFYFSYSLAYAILFGAYYPPA